MAGLPIESVWLIGTQGHVRPGTSHPSFFCQNDEIPFTIKLLLGGLGCSQVVSSKILSHEPANTQDGSVTYSNSPY